MNEPIEIRVGICGCLQLYRGELHGRGMRFGGRRYRLKEIILPNEKNHTKSLKRNRCHVFIDTAGNGRIYIFVSFHDLHRSPSGRSERLEEIDMFSGMTPLWDTHGVPRKASGIRHLIRKELAEMPTRYIRSWLRRMAFSN